MIQVVNRALDILEMVAEDAERPKLLSEIAQALQLNAGTCANIVKTLVQRGYLEKAATQKGYLPGKRLALLTDDTATRRSIIEAADPYMEELTRVLNENTLLAVLRGDERLVIHKKFCTQLIQAYTPDTKKAYDSSTGRLLVAMMKDDELQRYIHQYGLPAAGLWPGASSKKKFMQQVQQIRQDGFALIEDSVQVVGIATPVYRKKRVVACLSIYMPSFRVNDKMKQQLIRNAVSYAAAISTRLEG